MTLQVEGTCMPVIRSPNFSDETWDVDSAPLLEFWTYHFEKIFVYINSKHKNIVFLSGGCHFDVWKPCWSFRYREIEIWMLFLLMTSINSLYHKPNLFKIEPCLRTRSGSTTQISYKYKSLSAGIWCKHRYLWSDLSLNNRFVNLPVIFRWILSVRFLMSQGSSSI